MRCRKVVFLALLLASLDVLSGCHTVTFYDPEATGGKVYEFWDDFFLVGIVNTVDHDLSKNCPKGVARLEQKASFVNVLLAIVTIGIYTPRTTTVKCAK